MAEPRGSGPTLATMHPQSSPAPHPDSPGVTGLVPRVPDPPVITAHSSSDCALCPCPSPLSPSPLSAPMSLHFSLSFLALKQLTRGH